MLDWDKIVPVLLHLKEYILYSFFPEHQRKQDKDKLTYNTDHIEQLFTVDFFLILVHSHHY